MNSLMIAGSVLGLASVFLIHAADWTGRRLYRWSWWPVSSAAVAAFLASGAPGVIEIAAGVVVAVGGTLIAITFTAAWTGLAWPVTVTEYVKRQKRQNRPPKP